MHYTCIVDNVRRCITLYSSGVQTCYTSALHSLSNVCKSKYYGIEIPMMPCVVIATCQVKTCASYTKAECPVQTHSTLYIRELKQRGRERQRERYKTIDLITEYNHCTWECNHLATFSPSSLETERENLNSGVL